MRRAIAQFLARVRNGERSIETPLEFCARVCFLNHLFFRRRTRDIAP